MNMKLESSRIPEKTMEKIRDGSERLESVAPSMSEAREQMGGLMGFTKSCIRNFPMTAVWTSLAGGLLIGAALARRRHHSLQELYVEEPFRQGRKLLSEALSTAADAGRDRWEHARSAVRLPDLDALRREMVKMTRKMHF
ncbi:hypothetical protein CfE428DRAFT_6585 [Chthoniobacter flavus Ellin428]|uniref:Uncharacterized protein n=1 Tax=Chthoniobacter flavus Ellin428 TaxID=497964 RepID=B4DCE4_9BACT|nr:hypothetical protein [Chthoniobacter flavus]EDY15893.1 hypothetical protein CfE428DRAFT_6585 [Chthoniobacter flavus Ellin428]TCO87403.1 hypothetical protein EV701_12282 [Chthoniobacter flavus]